MPSGVYKRGKIHSDNFSFERNPNWRGGISLNRKNYDYRKILYLNSPWYKTYDRVKSRCKRSKSYLNRNIKLLMKPRDFEFLWFRDEAWSLENPSIDRIDGLGNYELSNCRYIELKENLKRKKSKMPLMA